MPNQTQSNIIGRSGERWFQSQLPSEWVFQTPSADVGVDGLVVILDKGELNGTEFRVQIKSSSNFTQTPKDITIKGIKKTTLLYWIHNPTPTLLVAYDNKNQSGYCSWISDIYFEQIINQSFEKQLFSFKIPKEIKVDKQCWDLIRTHLIQYRQQLKNAYLDREYTLPFLYKISAALTRLSTNELVKTIDGREPSKDELEYLYEVETMTYVSFYETLLEIDKNLKPTSLYSAQIKNIILSFRDKCDLAFPKFEDILTSNRMNALAVRINLKNLSEQRPLLKLTMISVLNLFLKAFEK